MRIQLFLFSDYSAIKINDEEVASKIFEFLASNTNVEWSNLGYSFNGENTNVITTIRSNDTEKGFYLHIRKMKGISLKSYDHSHPENSIYPSGIPGKTGDNGDIQAVGELNRRFNSNISARIFLPKYRMYVPYNENSNINDFEQAKKEKLCRQILEPVLESFYAPYSAF